MKRHWYTVYCRGDASVNAANSTVLAWTAASDSVSTLTRDHAGVSQTSSTRPAVQSKLSVGVHDTKQSTTQGEFVNPIYYKLLPDYWSPNAT